MANPDFIALLEPVIKGLKIYHRYAVSGLDYIPRKGRAIIVVNHSLATYDILMLIHSIYDQTGRLPRPLVDRLIGHIPMLSTITHELGCITGSPENAQQLLAEEQLIVVAPGGMAEAIRPHTQRYQTKWQDRKGFVRLAVNTNSPIILAFCPDSDNLYKVYDTKITRFMYRYLRLPMIIARGLGPTILPRPVKLKHFISEPIIPKQPKKVFLDRKSTRLNSSHPSISYAVFCLKKKKR